LERGHLLAHGSPRELAEKYRAGTQLELEISTSTLDKAISILGEHSSLQVQSIRGNLLQVKGLERAKIPDLIKRLIYADVELYRIQPDEATLEDVYFALHLDNNRERYG
jgi:ABC-2 type transport system ATP-binding protein